MKNLAIAIMLLAGVTSSSEGAVTRKIRATYMATLSDFSAGTKELKVWIPIPKSSPEQKISNLTIDSPYKWTRGKEVEFGNEYIYTTIRNPTFKELSVRISFDAERNTILFADLVDETATRSEVNRNLRADRLVTLSPRLKLLSKEITRDRKDPVQMARGIYDHLLATMKYDKVIPGWGKGDSERACDIRAGNCTDFHSLFMSLARARNIPTRFVIGFPLSKQVPSEIKGYHCWAEFFVEGKGWVPVDASDASKSTDPAVRNFLFGNLDPDRIQFTVGRDLKLKPATLEPLNFFIYPYAEADGQVSGVPTISLQLK